MRYTVNECAKAREDFPALARQLNGKPIAFLDGPGGTQVPETVLRAVREAYIERNANFDGMFDTSIAVTQALQTARQAAADFVGAKSVQAMSFGANMTTLNFSLAHALGRSMSAGDEIVITELDHEANRGPWLSLVERGIVVHEVHLRSDGYLDLEHFESLVNERTKVIALGLASNSLGSVPEIATARALCDKVGAYLVVDAVHYAAHFPLDVVALNIDFLLCSAYKFYGPHIGILYAREGLLDSLDTDRLCTQKSTAPYRIETGTLNHAALSGVTAAINYIASWGMGTKRREKILSAMRALHDYEIDLAHYYYDQVTKLSGVTVFGPPFDGSPRAPTVSITVANHTPQQASKVLATHGLQVWHGHFYAVKVLEVLGLVECGGLLRVGISMYNTREEIDRLIEVIAGLITR